MVESALVLLPFVLTLIGILDMGQVLFFYETLHERARAGARYAAVNSYDPLAIKNVVVYNTAGGTGSPLFGLNTSMVTVNRYDLATPEERVEVTISNYPVKLFSPLLAGVSLHRGDVRPAADVEDDVLADHAAQHAGDLLHHPVEAHRFHLQHLLAADGEKLAGEVAGPVGGVEDLPELQSVGSGSDGWRQPA